MNEHASSHRYGERADGRNAPNERLRRHWLLLVGVTMAFTVLRPLPGEAINGEPVGAEGLHRAGTCDPVADFDFTISCDDRAEDGVVSCHMRRPIVDELAEDEGLAINTCVDGRLTNGGTPTAFFEKRTTITATDFGEFVCGKDPADGTDFCLVCDTFKNPSASIGASNCVKIRNDGQADEEAVASCGAFNVSRIDSAVCESAELDLQQFFSDPHLGFSIRVNGTDASDPEAKDLVVCGSRSWQCIDNTNRSSEFPVAAGLAQQPQTHALIDTPCCMRLASGRYYCSATLTPSATCK